MLDDTDELVTSLFFRLNKTIHVCHIT
jgi:hypothetical protein